MYRYISISGRITDLERLMSRDYVEGVVRERQPLRDAPERGDAGGAYSGSGRHGTA
jgi:hypothetical protein